MTEKTDFEDEAKATHRCKICGCLWRDNGDSWSWVPTRGGPQNLGKCCDNESMGDQIEKLEREI